MDGNEKHFIELLETEWKKASDRVLLIEEGFEVTIQSMLFDALRKVLDLQMPCFQDYEFNITLGPRFKFKLNKLITITGVEARIEMPSGKTYSITL